MPSTIRWAWRGTDKFLMEVSRITGKPIPEALKKERGRLVDAIADSNAHIHGKKFAIYGDPDFCLGMAAFLMELGAEPRTVLSTNGGKAWEAKAKRFSPARPSARTARSMPARIPGICARCSSHSPSIS